VVSQDTNSLNASQGGEVDGEGKATFKCSFGVLEEDSETEVEGLEGLAVIKMPQSTKTFTTIGK